MKLQIVVRTEILATHQWPNAPEHRKYLASQHSHMFKFRAIASVSHSDRQIEFHDLRLRLMTAVNEIAMHRMDGPAVFKDMSCEQIGEKILKMMPELESVIVSEDGLCDAIITRESNDKHIEGNPRKSSSRVYLASSSKGDRDLLRNVASDLTDRGYMVFAPCLAFVGNETSELRPIIMDVCLTTLVNWAQDLIILDEGIPSIGCNIENNVAIAKGIPVSTIKTKKEN